MGRHGRGCAGKCNNDTCYPERYDTKKHVETLKFHRFPTSDEAKRNTWTGLGHQVCNIRFCTGFEKVETFQAIFDFLLPRSKLMKRWEGPKKRARIATASTSACQQKTDDIITSSAYAEVDELPINRKGPSRKLCLQQEHLLALMRSRLGLLVKDLGFRFQISSATDSQTWITWIKLLSKELRYLIIWPSKGQVAAILPGVF
eukprot:gene16570-18253_t